ncbi:exonuclease DPD1, chloroplastic/mitochondrial-like [Panicum virgatum]|uniref:exonuclease DPD1, chloroplastic/mitochondrial-like n=1 Tax=Panicum virgatum TaxID=38727 RepID=UPI0019D54C61|nr:exonuclease DPD1, chloroplastic/mitochondrial-like [Panicum virgatum]
MASRLSGNTEAAGTVHISRKLSLGLRFNLLRNNIQSSCPVRFLKQHAGFSYEKLLQPGSYEKRHFTTKLTETASWHKTDSASSATILFFGIETTGLLHADHRIIEFALLDLSGGKTCTFETLIRPEWNVPRYAAEANKITTELVCRPDVPRFSDVLPLSLAYVQSCQAPGKPILWVAHNAKQFDIPFVMQEFERCSAQVPADWLFVDSLCLARKLKKSDGNIGLVNLKALGEHYGVSSEGPSHRAMPDVQALCGILPKITMGLKLTCDGLMSEVSKFYYFRKVSLNANLRPRHS